MLLDVSRGILVDRPHAGKVHGLEFREGDGQLLAQLERRMAAEIGEPLALFFGHVIAVLLVRFRDCGEPRGAARGVLSDVPHGGAQLVVIADGVLGLFFRIWLAARSLARAQERRIKDLLLRFGVDFQERGEPRPDGAERGWVAAVDLLEDGKKPPLLVVVIEDELGDVDGRYSFRPPLSRFRAEEATSPSEIVVTRGNQAHAGRSYR